MQVGVTARCNMLLQNHPACPFVGLAAHEVIEPLIEASGLSFVQAWWHADSNATFWDSLPTLPELASKAVGAFTFSYMSEQLYNGPYHQWLGALAGLCGGYYGERIYNHFEE